jgi:hypothetical protein
MWLWLWLAAKYWHNASSSRPSGVQLLELVLHQYFAAIVRHCNRLWGLMVRVPGYRTEMYRVSCEVWTELKYVMKKKVEQPLCDLVVRVPGCRTEMYRVSCEVWTEFIYVMKKKVERLCGLVARVPGFRTETYCFLWGTNWIYISYVEESRAPLWSSGQSSWLQNGDVLFPVRYELNLHMLCRRK